jgi:hypothetical protein
LPHDPVSKYVVVKAGDETDEGAFSERVSNRKYNTKSGVTFSEGPDRKPGHTYQPKNQREKQDAIQSV